MTPIPKKLALDPEIEAIRAVHEALRSLEPAAQSRVLAYVAGKLGTNMPGDLGRKEFPSLDPETSSSPQEDASRRESDSSSQVAGVADGISPVALKWLARNAIAPNQLATLFSLGMDEIDLVAKAVPGKTKKDRMKNVILLKGMASYLGNGVARVSHAQVKEACLHYDGFDEANFARHLKSFSGEVSGSAKSGYTLTPRGMTSVMETIKGMITART